MWQADLRSYAQAMTRFAFSSVRARLLILVLLVIIPSLGLVVHMAREGRQHGVAQAGQSTLKLAREAATQQQRSISQARDFLSELSQYPDLDHPKAEACTALLAKKLNEHPEYVNVFVLTLDGELICSALPFEGRLNLSDRVYFQLAVTRKGFSVGEYQIGRVTGKATLAFGHPVLDETGKFTAVLAAALDLTRLSDLVKNARLPEGSAMLLIDSKGTVLVHHPDPPAGRRAGPQRIVGKSMTDQPLVRRLLASKGEEIGQEVGLDGVHRLYAFAPIRIGGDTRAYVGMGIPIEVAFADANRTLWRNLILLGLVGLLAFGAAWFGGDFFILRRVNDLVSATRRLASGDLSARTALPYEHSELSQLARSFDGMAESLKRRQAEIDQAQKAAHYSDQRLRMMVEAVQDYAIIMLDPDGYVVSWNSGAERIKGYQAKEIIGTHFSCFYPPEDIEHGRPEHGLKVASSEGRFEYEGWRLRKDGSRFWAYVVITAVHGDKGQLLAYSKVTHDLTERKRVEETLHARYQELQILYQTGQTVLTSPDLKTALEKILDEAVAVDSFDLGTILLVDPSGEKIEAAASRGYLDPANIERRPSDEATKWSRYRAGWYRNTTVVENVAETEGLRTLKREGVQSAVLTPVRAREKTLGILQVGSRTRRQFDADKVRLLEAIGNQMGIAVQKARLHDETQQNLAHIRALHEIDKAITSTLDLETVLNVLLEKIETFLPIAAATTIRLLNPQTGDIEFLACRGLDEKEWKAQQMRRVGGRARRVIETKALVTVRNIQADPQTYNAAIFASRSLVSYLGIPLIAKDEVLGVLNLYTRQEHDFTQEEIAFLDTLGHQAALAIHNARLYQEATVREKNLLVAHEQLDALHTITAIASQSLDLKTVTQGVIQKITEIFDFDATRIHLYNARRDELLLNAHFEKEPERFRAVGSFPRGQGIAGKVAESGEPLIFEDLTAAPLLESMSRSGNSKRKRRRFFAALPIKSGRLVLGTMVCIGFAPRRLSAEEVQLLASMAGQIAVAVENSRLFEETYHRADELTQKTFALEKANRAKDEFLAMISHELRTPLNVIMGYTGLVREGMFGALSPQQDDALKKVVIQSNDLLSIVSNLLRATQMGSGKIIAERARTDLGQLLDDIKNTYDLPGRIELTLNWDFPSDLPPVETDSEKLKHILVNLIHNAIKFTEKGCITIAARHLPKSKTLRFTVADTGPGISTDSLPIIFDKFHQLDSSNTRTHGGLGLGLYIVKKYTELLGGKIKVKSAHGRGSVFMVALPCESSLWRESMLPAVTPESRIVDPRMTES